MPDRSRSPVALLMFPAWVMKCVIGSRNCAILLRTRNVLELWNSERIRRIGSFTYVHPNTFFSRQRLNVVV
jgi:hypothetical protein